MRWVVTRNKHSSPDSGLEVLSMIEKTSTQFLLKIIWSLHAPDSYPVKILLKFRAKMSTCLSTVKGCFFLMSKLNFVLVLDQFFNNNNSIISANKIECKLGISVCLNWAVTIQKTPINQVSYWAFSRYCWNYEAAVILYFSHCQHIPLEHQNQQCVSPFRNTSWLVYTVCGSQPEAHWFLLKM